MVFNGVFGGMGHEHDILDTRRDGLGDYVLNERLVNERHHLLGDGFGGRQKARSQSRHGDDGVFDVAVIHVRHDFLSLMNEVYE